MVILVMAGATAWLYKNEHKIYEMVLTELNENQVGYTEVGYIDVSPFENFPYISIGLHQIDFYGDKEKSEAPIYHIDDAYVGFDVWSILKGEYTIKKLRLTDGYIRLVIDEDGVFNFTAAKASTSEEEQPASDEKLYLDLKSIKLENIRLEETNLQSHKYIDLYMRDVNAAFSTIQDAVWIDFEGDLELADYTAGETTFFKDKPFALDAEVRYDGITQMVTIMPSTLTLQYGNLNLEGSIDIANDVTLDLEVTGQKENFDVFISFAPNEVAEVLNQFRNEGDIFFKGRIFGPSINADPGVDIEMGCANTFFFHKDESKAVRDVAFNGRFHTGAKNNLETAELILSNLYGIPETGEFSGTIRVVDFTNPRVSVDFHADVLLENFQSFYDPDWLEDAGGQVRVDITINEFVDQDSVIHVASQLEDGTLSRIEFRDAWMKLTDYHHPLRDMAGRLVLDGDRLLLEKLACKVGESDLLMTASLGNLTQLAHHQDAPVDLTLHIESQKIDIASLLPAEMRDDTTAWKTEVLTELFADFDLTTTVQSVYEYQYLPEAYIRIRGFSGKLEGFDQPLHHIKGTVLTNDTLIDLNDLELAIGENDLHINLVIDDPGLLMDRTLPGAVHFHTDLWSDRIDLKDFLYYRGQPLVSEEVQAELGDERIRDLLLSIDGYIHPSTMSVNGVQAYGNIEKFTVQLNDLPKLHRSAARLRADTTGCLYIDDFTCAIGNSDFHADLQLLHLLDTLGDKREIYGKIGGSLWDFDALTSHQKGKASQAPAETATTQAEAHAADLNIFVFPFPQMDLELEVGKLRSARYKLDDLYGHFKASPDHMVWIDTLHFKAASGAVAITGYLNGSVPDDLYLTGTIALDEVNLDEVFMKFDNFGQDYLVSDQLHGRLSGTIRAKAHLYPDLAPKLDRTEAKMQVTVRDGRLENFAPMQAMSDFMGNRNLNNIRFGEMENTFEYADGALVVPRMKISSTIGYIHLSGKQRLDDQLDYEIQVPLSLVKSAGWSAMRSKLRGGRTADNPDDLAEEKEEEIISSQGGLIRKYLTFSISGTTDDFAVSMGRNKNLAQEKGK